MYTWNELYHHGIKGQKWYVRRFQNEDGTLTEAGKQRYRHYTGEDIKVPKTYGLRIGKKANRKFEEQHQARRARILETNREIANAIGEEAFKKALDSVNHVIERSDNGDFNDYHGKYRKEWDAQVKEYNDIDKKFQQKKAELWAEIDELKATNGDASHVMNDIIRNPKSEINVLQKQRNELYSQIRAKETIYQNDWESMTIEQALKSVPKKYKDSMYDVLKFDPGYSEDEYEYHDEDWIYTRKK